MIRAGRRITILAACLSALAGFVDATGFIQLGGFFVSFMSGNSTRLSVGIAQGTTNAAIAGGLIAGFVVGVIVGSLVGHAAKSHRRWAVLATVTLLLVLAAGCNTAGLGAGAVVAMTLAMGAENATFERDGEVHIGLTYMTGTLVKLGQRLTAAFLGGDKLAWAPYLLLWLGLVAGAVAGAVAYAHLGRNSLWVAAVVAAVLTLFAARMGDKPEAA